MEVKITLPCEVETTVYYINTYTWQIFECKIHEFCITADGTFAILDDEYKGISRIRIRGVRLSDFGKIVFFTEEEAAKAIAERAGKNGR